MGCCTSRPAPATSAPLTSEVAMVVSDETKLDLSTLEEKKLFSSRDGQQHPPLTGQQSIVESETSFRQKTWAHRTSVLIACHPTDILKARQIQTAAASVFPQPQTVLIDNSGDLDYREALVRWADVVVLMTSYSCQNDLDCRDLASYVIQMEKPLISVVTEEHFDPTGDIGVASKSCGKICRWTGNGRTARDFVTETIMSHTGSTQPISPVPKPTAAAGLDIHGIYSGAIEGTFICATDKGKMIADLISTAQGIHHRMAEMRVLRSDQVGPSPGFDEIHSSLVFIAVLTEDFEASDVHRRQFEFARRIQREIVLVKSGDFLCKKWLALAVAGKIIYNISTDKQAYQQFTLGLETTYVMNELVNRIFKAVIRPQHVARAAESHLQLVTLIQEYQKRLPSWPPDNTFVENPRLIPIPNKNDLLPTTSKDILPTQHLTIDPNTGQMIDTTNILPVQQLIVPSTPGKLDCLLIGDFISQQLVAAVSEALRALSISHTTHLWSAPYETNINSMANCVEASNAVVIFLTDKFQKSQKGQLTLKYSLALNKPILFILEQPSIKLKIKLNTSHSAMLAQTVAIELSSPEDLQSPMMGFPKIHVLSTALLKLRWWANQQPKRLARDVSETTYRLQVKLENCRNALEKLNDSIIFLE